MCTLVQYSDKTLFSHRVLKRAKGSMRQHAQLRAIKPTGDRQYLAHGNGHLSSQPAVSLGIASSISSPKSLIQFPRIERRTLSRIVRRWPVGLVLLWHQTLVSWLLLIAIASVTSSRLQQCLATTQNPPSCAGFVSSLNANLTGQRPLLPGRGAKKIFPSSEVSSNSSNLESFSALVPADTHGFSTSIYYLLYFFPIPLPLLLYNLVLMRL